MSDLRRVLGRARRRVMYRGRASRQPSIPWVATLDEPSRLSPFTDVPLYAIVGTWMEADVIADTVRNAFVQGAERVFIVDNASPDDTVQRASEAGAEHAVTFRGDGYDEAFRIAIMNDVVHHVSGASGADHTWWLWLDADEFPRPQGPGTIRDVIDRLDRRCRVVGGRFLNHYPTPGATPHVAGHHPAFTQPLCEELHLDVCGALHRKHPLQRWDRVGPRLDAGLGFHRAECQQRPLYEPAEPLVIHHVPFRDEQTTRRRMHALWRSDRPRATRGDIATDHMEARFRSVDAVYRGDWANVHTFMPGAPETGVDLVDWRELEPSIHPEVPTW